VAHLVDFALLLGAQLGGQLPKYAILSVESFHGGE
jgi:hypothetical protein